MKVAACAMPPYARAWCAEIPPPMCAGGLVVTLGAVGLGVAAAAWEWSAVPLRDGDAQTICTTTTCSQRVRLLA